MSTKVYKKYALKKTLQIPCPEADSFYFLVKCVIHISTFNHEKQPLKTHKHVLTFQVLFPLSTMEVSQTVLWEDCSLAVPHLDSFHTLDFLL